MKRLSKRERLLEGVQGWVWDELEASWEFGYGRLLSFVNREGNGRVPVDYRDDDGFGLGKWAVNQRARRGELSEERQQRLDAVPGWVWDTQEAAWEDGFARLQSFAEREGHSRVPQLYLGDDVFRLGQWVAVQRDGQRSGKLSEERRQRLEVLPGWAWDALEAAWEEAMPGCDLSLNARATAVSHRPTETTTGSA